MTGILTLGRPKAGVVSTFDAREYSLIDFLPIEHQWTALVQVGLTLRIVFSDGSVIELLNFYSFSLAGDSSGGDYTGTLADASGDLLVRTSATGLMSMKEFARTYWTTKTSGYVAVPAFEGHDGEQASGGLTGQNAPDNVPLSFPPPPPPSASGGVEFPLPPVPPPLFLPPQVTHPPNNAAVIAGDTAESVVEAGGVTNAIPGVPVVSGDLDAADVDGPADSWNAVGAPTPSANGYGTFMMTASGVWTYTLNNSDAAVDALAVGAALNDTFTVTTVDGTSQRVTITITGANDAPVVTGAVDSGMVTEGPLPVMTATGTIDFGDVDLADAHVTSVTPGGSGYLGTFVADIANDSTGDGSGEVSWVFLANNQLRQSLQTSQQLVQTYTVEIDDGHGGTVSQLVTITINGTNDAAVVTGDTAGSVVEAGGVANNIPGIPAVNGDLNSADVDDPDDVWQTVGSPAASANGYGSYVMTATGVWTYTLDNNNATVQALNDGVPLIDSFMAVTADGTTQLVTITITGANDAAEITGDVSGAVTEDGDGVTTFQTVSGVLAVTDEDTGDNQLQPIAAGAAGSNGYGTFEVSADGTWTYTLDNADPAVQALPAGQTLQDTILVTSQDGTSTQLITITITGANDAPVISGDITGTVIEAGGVNNGTPGTPTATGDLNSADVDNPGDSWQAVAAGATTTNGFGSYALDANGAWTYTLDDSNPTVQALNVGDPPLTDSFTALTVDGTAQVVTITITGTNDAAVIIGNASGAVTEAGGVANGSPGTSFVVGDLHAADVDNTSDSWTAIDTPTLSANGYGTFTIDAAGLWVYILDNGNPAVQTLNVGDSLTDTFTATTADGTTQLVTITINGSNDAAVITGPVTGTVVEAGGIVNGTPGTPTATGDLHSADVDNTNDAWQAVAAGATTTSGFGSYALDANGVWTYTLDDSNPAVQALNIGDRLTDRFTVTTIDGTAQLVIVTINGANDAAVITGDTTGSLIEASGVANGTPGTEIAAGHLNSTDVDNPDDAWNPVGASLRGDNSFGSYTLTTAGVWTYTLDNSNATVQALNVGQTLIDTFTATTVDGTAQLVTITINGANDVAVISGVANGSVTEAGGVANGTPGIPIATGDLNSTDVDNPSDAWTAVGTATASTKGYGTYTLTAAGLWTYTLDNSNADVQARNVGQILSDTFTVFAIDGTSQVVTITIHGTNDAAVVSGATTGSVVEAGAIANDSPGTPTGTGDLNFTDVDDPNDAWMAVGTPIASASGYGSYTLTAAGVWTYTLNNSHAAVQALSAGQTLTDTFTVATVDGTAQLVTVTITGANDAAVISGVANGAVVEVGGVANGTPGTPTATGDLNASDVDNTNDAWTAVSSPAASVNGYGTYTLTAAGVWAFTLNNSNAAVQALNVGDTLTDRFTVTTIDGTTQLVIVTINGANDAAVISGTASGNVTEAGGVNNGTPGTPVATGNLNSIDGDNPSDAWTAVGTAIASTNGYGTYTLTAAGLWVYALNNSNAAVQALNVGQTLTDTFTVATVDGTAQLVTVAINGANDAAVITGPVTGTVLEAGDVNNNTPGAPTATGNLDATDVDNPNDAWAAVSSPAASANGFGSYTLTAAGVWTYTLNNSNPAVQALNVGDTLIDTFTVATVDGTAQLVTVTINGANDAAVVTGATTGSVIEEGGVGSGIPGIPVAVGHLDASEVDNPPDDWTPVATPTPGVNGYGSYTLTAAGVWTYTLDNSNAAVQALSTGQTLTDTFTAVTVDGTQQSVTITIHGTDDAAVISGDITGTVLEAGGVANGTPGIPTATGALNAADADSPPDWTPVVTLTPGDNGFGSYTLTAAGVWTYTLDDSNPTVQALNPDETLTDTFTAGTVDGSTQLITITIHGANDTAVITGPVTGTVTEAGGVANGTPGTPTATGNLTSTDVDNPNDAWQPDGTLLRGDSGFSTYTVTADGVWTYTLDNSNPAVQALNVGQTLTDTLTAITVDGTQQRVTITINGANDAAVITGTATGAVTEAGGVANGTPGTPTATGDLNSTDADNPNDAWAAVSPTTSGFGSYALTATGVWTYTLNNSNATVQALNAGQILTDTFTAVTVDGTQQLVTITINGTNDAAVISGTVSGSVTEAGGVANGTPGTPTATGNLNSTDVDNPSDIWEPVGTLLRGDSGFSTYTLTAAGVWTYTLDDSNPVVQALNVGQTLTDTFTAFTVDGTAQLVTITIDGTNDAAVITGKTTGSVIEAGGVNNGTPGAPTATGDLNSTDADNPNDAWAAVSPTTSGFGSYALTATGVWTYTLNNSNATVQALNAGQILTDTFTAVTVDGTQQLVTITINGTNDAAVISGVANGSVTEAGGVNNGTPGTPTATGNLTSTDVDNPNDLWEPIGTPLQSEFGSYTLTAAGVWTYTLDNDNPAVQARNVGQTLTDTFTVTTIDGTQRLLTITINGANDAAVITGPVTGTVLEAGEVNNSNLGTPTATGDLNSFDIDNPNDIWTAVAAGAASASGFGSYALTATGGWTYTLNNSNATVQALNVGQTLTDTFTATTVGGTQQLVTITINGSNDTPAAAADNNAGDPVTESGVNPGNTPFAGDPSAAGSVLNNDLDVDSGDTKTVVAVNGEAPNVGKPLIGTYGTLTLLANGSWSYALDNADPDTNALAQGQTATDVFTYTMADASGATSSAPLTIAVTGTNDAPDIILRSGDSATANLTETGAGLATSGTMTVRDPELTNAVTASVTAVALSGTTGGLTAADVLGMLSVSPGSIAADPGDTNNLGWAFNSGAQAFNFLNSGDTLTLAYTVQATDGSASDAQTVTVTIAGTGGGPAANDDNILVSNSTTVIIPWSALLANDSDPNATITGVTNLNGVTGGTIPVFNLGFAKIIVFTTPDTSDLTGNTFTYTVSNGSGTSTATVNVGVMQVNTDARDTPDLSARTYDFSYISAGGNNDTFTGGPGTDDFFGGGGNDTYQFAFTGGGNDLINESILGGAGNDIIQIRTPVNASYTDLNFQRVDADSDGSVDDLLITYNGQSITVINEFNATAADHVETMSFNGGNYAGYSLGTGPYTIDATTGGNDTVAGTNGDDSLNGGSAGNDLIFAGAGNDTVDGGRGNDLLVAGTGNDTIFGGGGDDTYVFTLNDGIDTINENGGANAGGGNDQITIMANGAALSSLNFFDSVAGVGGNLVIDYNGQQITVINEFAAGNNSFVETLTFSDGASYLGYDLSSATYTLGRGANSIQAGDGAANTTTGGLGRDLIFGNAGNDTITGGGGEDLMVGGAGNDTVTGGLDNDVLVGGSGNDVLAGGGGGNDRFVFAEAGPANVDTITDYQASRNNVIDLSPLLDSQFGPTDNPADFARLVQNGSDVVVQADLDGAANGQNWDSVAVLQAYGTTGQDVVHVHFGNTTYDMLV